MKAVIVIFLLFLLYSCLSGCAITDEERNARLVRTNQIEKDFYSFVADCYMTDGELVIDRSLENRRVQNAPITVWEMRDAQCFYPDERFPRRMP